MKKYKGIKTLEVLEGADNYNEWIASRIRPFISPPVLEVGAGTGNISEYLKNIKDITFTDVDQTLVKKLIVKFSSKKNVRCEVLDVASRFGKINNHFKSVYAVNVIEHIKDDKKALRNIHLLLEKRGKVVLLVPAKKYAYNNLDKKLGHFRRYEKEELKKKLESAGFSVSYLEYFNVMGLVSWVVREKISRKSHELKPNHVRMFDVIVPVLKRIEPKKGLPFGISLLAVGQKI